MQLKYTTEMSGSDHVVELPFVTGVLADLSGNASAVEKPDMNDRKFLDIDMENFDKRMAAIEPAVSMTVANKLGRGRRRELVGQFEVQQDGRFLALRQSPGRSPAIAKLLQAREQLTELAVATWTARWRRGHVEETSRRSGPDGGNEDETGYEGRPTKATVQLEQKDAAAAAPVVVEADEFGALLKQSFKPRTNAPQAKSRARCRRWSRKRSRIRPSSEAEVIDTIQEMVARLDEKLSAQLNAILHAPEFQQLESTWRGLSLPREPH